MKITWLGHSAFRLEFDQVVVMIDPFLTGNPSFTGDPVAASAGTTHVLLTHGHADHIGDTVAIAERNGAKLIATYELCQFLGAKGVAAADPMNTGGTTDQGSFTVTLTPALHSSSEMDANGVLHNLGLPNGLILRPKQKEEPVIYHMGDTDIFSDMALIAEIHEPDIAIVPIGDRFTMGARTAAMAMRRFLPRAKTVLPCHYATFGMLDQSPDAFLREMGDQAGRVRVPAVGEPFTV